MELRDVPSKIKDEVNPLERNVIIVLK